MPSRPEQPVTEDKVPGGSYTAIESARVVRAQLKASDGRTVAIKVTNKLTDEKIITLTVSVLTISRTTAACRLTTGGRPVIIMLGRKNEKKKKPIVLLADFV